VLRNIVLVAKERALLPGGFGFASSLGFRTFGCGLGPRRVAQKALILIESVLFAVGAFGITKLRVAFPTPVFVAPMLLAPEPPGLALGGILNETRLAISMIVGGSGGAGVVGLGLGALLFAAGAS